MLWRQTNAAERLLSLHAFLRPPQSTKWHLLAHRRREERHREMGVPEQQILKWTGRWVLRGRRRRTRRRCSSWAALRHVTRQVCLLIRHRRVLAPCLPAQARGGVRGGGAAAGRPAGGPPQAAAADSAARVSGPAAAEHQVVSCFVWMWQAGPQIYTSLRPKCADVGCSGHPVFVLQMGGPAVCLACSSR